MDKETMNVLSLFDGMSCGRIALERAGISVTNYYASEIDKFAIKVSQANYADIIRLGDVTKINCDLLPKINLLMGGLPCQPYSIAGKRQGFEDVRGGILVDSMIKIIAETQPKYIMLENVKGLLSIEKGHIFKIILKQLNEIGYAVDWGIINSSLVSAQNRERLYIIGKRLDICQGLSYTIDLINNNMRSFKNATSNESPIGSNN